MLSLLLSVIICVASSKRAYDNDLRSVIVYQRLVLNIDAAIVAQINNVSIRSVQRYVERFENYNTIVPDASLHGETRGRRGLITPYDSSVVVEIITDDPTLFLDEIRSELIARGGSNLTIPTLDRWLRGAGYTRQRLFQVCFYICSVSQPMLFGLYSLQGN